MERARIVKVSRTAIRLRHSLAADEELNEKLPATLAAFDTKLANGELSELEVDWNEVARAPRS